MRRACWWSRLAPAVQPISNIERKCEPKPLLRGISQAVWIQELLDRRQLLHLPQTHVLIDLSKTTDKRTKQVISEPRYGYRRAERRLIFLGPKCVRIIERIGWIPMTHFELRGDLSVSYTRPPFSIDWVRALEPLDSTFHSSKSNFPSV